MNEPKTPNPNSAAAPSGSSNGGAGGNSRDAESVLLQMMAQAEATPPDDQAAPADAQTAPEVPTTPAESETPAEDLPPETPADAEAPADEQQTDLSNTEATMPPELAALPEGIRSELLAMAKDVAEGKTNFGELKRGHRLMEKFQTELEQLKSQLADKTPETAAAPQPGNLPSTVAKLKTLAEVQQRQELAESYSEAIQDFLDANPGDPNATYTIGNEELTRQQLIERRAGWRAEVKSLPKRAEQITQAAQFEQQRQQTRAATYRDYPILKDEVNPVAVQARQLAEMPYLKTLPNGDYIALALAKGDAALKAELAAKAKPGLATAAAKPANGIQKGKLSSAAAAAAPRTGTVNVKALAAQVKKDGSADSMLKLVAAM